MKTASIINAGVVFILCRPLAEIPDGWKECRDVRVKIIFGRNPNGIPFKDLNTDIGSKEKSTCLGILLLSKRVQHPCLDNACKRAVAYERYNLAIIKNILEKRALQSY